MRKIAVLGGGQLGMMMQESIGEMPIELHFLDPDPLCSAKAVSEHVTLGSFKDEETVMAFCADKDVITVEIEHVNLQALYRLEEMGKEVYPQPAVLECIIDKGLQKQFFADEFIPTAPFELLESGKDALKAGWKPPFVLKSRTGGYDGKGVQVIRSVSDMVKAFDGPCVLEELAPIKKELAVIVARSIECEMVSFPVVEMDFEPELNLVRAVLSPARIPDEVADKAREIAETLIDAWGLVGLLAVEFFWCEDGSLWVNEVAPRPHNSGHHSIDGNVTSQFQQHLRAISGMDLGDASVQGAAAMVNLLGAAGHQGKPFLENEELLKKEPKAFLHDYHKSETRPGRKMGHLTVLSEDVESALEKALELRKKLNYVKSST
jgi:5-(carboxyamino)imidazole ribonucleotide synthase